MAVKPTGSASGRGRDRGAAAVEFALVVPMLVLLVVGIAEFGRAYHLQTTLSGVAREGVRVMALQNSEEAARITVTNYADDFGLDEDLLAVSATSCSTGGRRETEVTVSYPFTFATGFLRPDITDFTVTGKGIMRCNG